MVLFLKSYEFLPINSQLGPKAPARSTSLSFDESDFCRDILESLPTGVCVLDTQKRIVLWSDGAERITGHLRHEVLGRCCIADPLLHCDQPGCEFCNEECPLAHAMKTSHNAEGTGILYHKAGHEIPVRARAVPVRSEHGSIVGAVEIFEELQQSPQSDRASCSSQVAEFLDAVTGTANHAAMERHLRRALSSFREMQAPFGIFLVQVEKLGHFRANLGAEAGFSFLRLVARTLESAFSFTDFIGRWRDDQFLVVVNEFHEEALSSIRERIRRILAREGIEWWGERHSLPVSIGGAFVRPDDTFEMLLDRAQQSLSTASAWITGADAAGSNSSGSL